MVLYSLAMLWLYRMFDCERSLAAMSDFSGTGMIVGLGLG
jgi:hypothetical protein